jgi:hypothetical protein
MRGLMSGLFGYSSIVTCHPKFAMTDGPVKTYQLMEPGLKLMLLIKGRAVTVCFPEGTANFQGRPQGILGIGTHVLPTDLICGIVSERESWLFDGPEKGKELVPRRTK